MHKKLSKPSLLYDDDNEDDETSNFGKSSNRFLKSKNQNNQPKENLQRESNDRFTLNRSVTPKSIDTDSDIGIDEETDNLASLKTSNYSSAKNNTLGGSGWQPDLKKSPRLSLLNNDANNSSNLKSLQPNNKQKNQDLTKQKSIFDDKPIDSDKSKRSENLYSKSPRDDKTSLRADSTLNDSHKLKMDLNSNKSNKDNKYSGKDFNEGDEDDHSNLNTFEKHNTSFMNTLRYSESKDVSNMFDTIKARSDINENSQKPKRKFDSENKDDDSHNSISSNRFLKSDKSKTPEGRFGKSESPRELNPIKEKLDFNPKPNKSKAKFDMDYDDDEPSNSLSSTKFLKSKISDDKSDKLEFNQKLNKPKNKFSVDDDDEDLTMSSTKFMKSSKSKYPEEKSEFNQKSNPSKNNFQINDDENDQSNKFPSSNRFIKSPRSKISNEKSELSQKSNTSQNKFNNNDDENDESDKFPSSNRFMKSPRSDFSISQDPFNEKSKFSTKLNKPQSKFDIFEHEDNNSKLFSKSKEPFDPFNQSNSRELNGSSKFLRGETNPKFNNFDEHDQELTNSTKLLKFNQANEFENSIKSDLKPKPRKSHLSKSVYEDINDKDNHPKNMKDDFKRRSIRFEDEESDHLSKSPNEFSRESSPIKSDITPRSSRKNSLSPPTSICEEVVQDPVTLKLQAIKKRREEKKRENELKYESEHNKLVTSSINTVSDFQQEPEPIRPIDSAKPRKSRPTSAKYKNVQPKISTRVNLKDLKSPLPSPEWSSTPDLYSNEDNMNTDRSYTSSQFIRDSAYKQWYLAKISESNAKKQLNTTNEEKKKNATEEERIAAYEAWKNDKREYFIELAKKKKEEEKKKIEESKVPEKKDNKSAELAFEVWKKQKEEKNKEVAKKNAKIKKDKELSSMKEREEKKTKKNESLTEWETKKAKEIQDKKLQSQKEEKEKEEKENEIKEKLLKAENAYRKWEEEAELKEKKYSEFEKNKEVLINNRRAWRPSTNAIVKTRRT